jgi:hypothetical protein
MTTTSSPLSGVTPTQMHAVGVAGAALSAARAHMRASMDMPDLNPSGMFVQLYGSETTGKTVWQPSSESLFNVAYNAMRTALSGANCRPFDAERMREIATELEATSLWPDAVDELRRRANENTPDN